MPHAPGHAASLSSGRAGAPGHFPGHLAGIAVGHAGDEVDHAQECRVEGVMRVRRVVADQVQHAAALERRGAPAMLLEGGAAEGVEQDLKGGVGANFMQRLALVLEDLVACHGLGLEHAALGGAVHVLDQVTTQLPGEQCLLLFDESARSGIGEVLDGLAPQDCQFAPAGVRRAELTVGFGQVIPHQVQQQCFYFGVLQQLHLQAIFQVDQPVADVVCCLHQVDQGVACPTLLFQQRQAKLVGDLLQ